MGNTHDTSNPPEMGAMEIADEGMGRGETAKDKVGNGTLRCVCGVFHRKPSAHEGCVVASVPDTGKGVLVLPGGTGQTETVQGLESAGAEAVSGDITGATVDEIMHVDMVASTRPDDSQSSVMPRVPKVSQSVPLPAPAPVPLPRLASTPSPAPAPASERNTGQINVKRSISNSSDGKERDNVTGPELIQCSACGTTCVPMVCGGCKQAAYCSSECQRNHWLDHKAACKAHQANQQQQPQRTPPPPQHKQHIQPPRQQNHHEQLEAMGFAPDQVVKALSATRGDLDSALALLLRGEPMDEGADDGEDLLLSTEQREASERAASMQEQIEALGKSMSPVDLQATVGVLATLTCNVLNDPRNMKFAQVRVTGNTFKTRVSAHPPAMRLLTVCGWRQNGDMLVLPSPPDLARLWMLKDVLGQSS